MKRLGLKAAAAGVVVVVVVGLLYDTTDVSRGESLFSRIGFSWPRLPSGHGAREAVFERLFQRDSSHAGGEPITVYKWIDDAGLTHYAQQNPNHDQPELSAVQALRLDPNTNIIAADALPVIKAVVEDPPRTMKKPAAQPVSPILNPAGVAQLIEEARDVQGLMDTRTRALNRAIVP